MYQSINEYYTVADTSVSFNPTVTNTNRNVQVTNAIDLSINLDSYSLSAGDVVVFKVDNSYEGLIQDIDAGNDTSNYDYYYFHTINMILARRTTTTISTLLASTLIHSPSTIKGFQVQLGQGTRHRHIFHGY